MKSLGFGFDRPVTKTEVGNNLMRKKSERIGEKQQKSGYIRKWEIQIILINTNIMISSINRTYKNAYAKYASGSVKDVFKTCPK